METFTFLTSTTIYKVEYSRTDIIENEIDDENAHALPINTETSFTTKRCR